MPRRTILSVGKDTELLCDRNRSLRESGYTVIAAHNRNEAVVLSGDRHFDLIVLCWSFGWDSNSIAADLAIVCPEVPVLILQPPSEQKQEAANPSVLEQVGGIFGSRSGRRVA